MVTILVTNWQNQKICQNATFLLKNAFLWQTRPISKNLWNHCRSFVIWSRPKSSILPYVCLVPWILKSPLNSVLKTRFHRVAELIPIPLLLQTQHLSNSWVKVWQTCTTTVYPIFTEWLTSLKLVQFLLLWLSVWSDILPFAGHCGFVLEDVILVST